MFDLNYFCGQSHFGNDGTQNSLVFQPSCRCFEKIVNSKHISVWKSKGLSIESIKPPATSNNSLSQLLNYINAKIHVKCDGGVKIKLHLIIILK